MVLGSLFRFWNRYLLSEVEILCVYSEWFDTLGSTEMNIGRLRIDTLEDFEKLADDFVVFVKECVVNGDTQE